MPVGFLIIFWSFSAASCLLLLFSSSGVRKVRLVLDYRLPILRVVFNLWMGRVGLSSPATNSGAKPFLSLCTAAIRPKGKSKGGPVPGPLFSSWDCRIDQHEVQVRFQDLMKETPFRAKGLRDSRIKDSRTKATTSD